MLRDELDASGLEGALDHGEVQHRQSSPSPFEAL
jgi:hypothetical protein